MRFINSQQTDIHFLHPFPENIGLQTFRRLQLEITGTVEQVVSLAGPHATMKVRAQGQLWEITLAPPARTQSAGLTDKAIPVGAQVTIHGHRNSDPKRFEIKTERVTWNGKTFNVYPDRS